MHSRTTLANDFRSLGVMPGDVVMLHASVRAVGCVAGGPDQINPHVARFAAWGAKADTLFSDQPWDYAYGRGSALDRLPQLGGKILLLGCDHDTVTFLHYSEHIVDIPDKRVVRYQVPVQVDGERTWRRVEEFDTSAAGVHPHWTERFFAQIVDSHLTATDNRGSLIGDARSYLIDAGSLLEFALIAMRRVAADASAADELQELSTFRAGMR